MWKKKKPVEDSKNAELIGDTIGPVPYYWAKEWPIEFGLSLIIHPILLAGVIWSWANMLSNLLH